MLDYLIVFIKFQKEGYNKENAVFGTRQFFTLIAISISATAQNIGLLNILEEYEQSSRYPDPPKLDENNQIIKQKANIRNTIASFIELNKRFV